MTTSLWNDVKIMQLRGLLLSGLKIDFTFYAFLNIRMLYFQGLQLHGFVISQLHGFVISQLHGFVISHSKIAVRLGWQKNKVALCSCLFLLPRMTE